MNEKLFDKKIKKLIKEDPIFTKIPMVSDDQLDKLRDHIDSVPDLNTLIEDIISQYSSHFEEVPIEYMSRYLAYSIAIAVDQHLKVHKIPTDSKKQKHDAIRNAAIYTFYRTLEKYQDWLLEQEDSNDE